MLRLQVCWRRERVLGRGYLMIGEWLRVLDERSIMLQVMGNAGHGSIAFEVSRFPAGIVMIEDALQLLF